MALSSPKRDAVLVRLQAIGGRLKPGVLASDQSERAAEGSLEGTDLSTTRLHLELWRAWRPIAVLTDIKTKQEC